MANKAMIWLEKSLAPELNKASRNIWIETIKDAVLQTIPLILVSSLITVINVIPRIFQIENFPNMGVFSNYTMGLIGLFVAFLIPFNYLERKKLYKMRIIAAMSGVCLFLLVIKFDNLKEMDYRSLGAGGMFAAIIVGVISALVMSVFAEFSFFSKESQIPDFIKSWFDSIIPVAILLTLGWIIVYLLNFNLFSFIQGLFKPLVGVAESFPGFVLIYFIICFMYSMGISTWLFDPITVPIMLAGIQANIDMVAQGQAPIHVMTAEVYRAFLRMGGTGLTLSLTLMLLFSKSKQLKSLGKATIFPGILNINEPVVFGCIVWNPVLMIGMWLQGLIIPAITWIGLKSGLVRIPSEVFALWNFPTPVISLIVSGFSGLILFVVLFAVSGLIWYPLFKIYEKQLVLTEQNLRTDKKD
jgi:PTS system cellobiose-specific IIC component